MRIQQLQLTGVRNLAPLELTPTSRFTVFVGDNGQGKTNLLETIFVVAALRSFRTARLADLVAFGAPHARIAAQVDKGGLRRVYELVLEPPGRRIRLDGKVPRPLARYFGGFNVVLFAPEDLQLPRGAPAARRRFLDRAVFVGDPGYLEHAADYDKVLRARNALLRQASERGVPGGHLGDLLAVYDQQLAELGARIVVARQRYVDAIRPAVRAAFAAIFRAELEVDVGYERTTTAGGDDQAAVQAALHAELGASRARDLARGATSVGPHRDDLGFRFEGRDAGTFASQGQLRGLVLAWKTAELQHLTAVTQEAPILLLDDVSSELDPARNAYLFEHLATLAGQCFVTTTDARHVLLAAAERRDLRVSAGVVTEA
ncbi:MAG: DNA replication/repair protein RecF [Kofleriaceae bacterium]